jgi:hypothetical protein
MLRKPVRLLMTGRMRESTMILGLVLVSIGMIQIIVRVMRMIVSVNQMIEDRDSETSTV